MNVRLRDPIELRPLLAKDIGNLPEMNLWNYDGGILKDVAGKLKTVLAGNVKRSMARILWRYDGKTDEKLCLREWKLKKILVEKHISIIPCFSEMRPGVHHEKRENAFFSSHSELSSFEIRPEDERDLVEMSHTLPFLIPWVPGTVTELIEVNTVVSFSVISREIDHGTQEAEVTQRVSGPS